MKRISLICLLILFSLLTTGCASFGNRLSLSAASVVGGAYRVTLYSGGKPVREWQMSNGIVNEEEGSDGWYFNCKSHVVRISGDVVVEPLDESKNLVSDAVVCN